MKIRFINMSLYAWTHSTSKIFNTRDLRMYMDPSMSFTHLSHPPIRIINYDINCYEIEGGQHYRDFHQCIMSNHLSKFDTTFLIYPVSNILIPT